MKSHALNKQQNIGLINAMSILLDLFYRQKSFAPFPFAKLKTNKVTKNIVCIKQTKKKNQK